MIENVGRTITVILLAVGTALALLFLKEQPFNLGLDLQGGTRLEYRFDIQAARDRGAVPPTMSDADVLAKTIDTIRSRIDPTGVLEASLRPQPPNGVVIELPTTASRGGVSANSSLSGAMEASAQSIPLGADAELFPAKGGIVRIGSEQVRYSSRVGSSLIVAADGRGVYSTTAVAHEAGAGVRLVQSDMIREKIENLGELQFAVQLRPADLIGEVGVDIESERSKLQNWILNNEGSGLVEYNDLSQADGGAWDGPEWQLHWYPFKINDANPVPEFDRCLPVKHYPAGSDYSFTGDDLVKVNPSIDQMGLPAVGFEMKATRKADFGRFTEENVENAMPVILNGVIETAPNINGRLPGGGIIQGRYTEEEVKTLVTILDSGSLKIKPTLEHEDKVGASLGAEYVARGVKSGAIALLLVLAFMWLYYRRLGLYAVVSLLATALLLMGGLSFVNATLTLPGIAGIILTVGMAVDANILIFDRIREELDKGRNLKQGTKAGFDKAFSAIFDANLTTLITAIILYTQGTGPVRGFAVTLIIGILVSVFSALVITRLLVHFALERGTERFHVGQWMVKANYNFMSKAKLAVVTSTVIALGAMAYFVILPSTEKMGIDFLGGTELQVVTREGMSQEALRDILDQRLPEQAAQVTPVLSSNLEGGYTRFRVVSKLSAGAAEEMLAGGEQNTSEFQDQVATGLQDILLESAVQIGAINTTDTGATVDLRLLFDESHSTDDIAQNLTQAGVTNANVSDDSLKNAYKATGLVAVGSDVSELRAKIVNAFSNKADSTGVDFRLTEAIPNASKVGPAVVGELQNNAILALLVSLFAIVMYIRVRFTEYSYGIAAVAALTHDVLITLGALMLGNQLGIVNGEINLSMIAVFLTIIGYSLNDTIVIFDRIRENLPVMRKPLDEVLNISINQTLSRTILTSVTTFMAVGVMYIFNFGTGNVLESFSFAMMIGIISGTYSTIFIANPVLLWLEGRAHKQRLATGETRDNDRVLHPAIEGN